VKAITVLLANGRPLILEGVLRSLVDAAGIRIIGEAHDGRELLPLVKRLQREAAKSFPRFPNCRSKIWA
jgi:DNA-binding NarL/FixJ family response regulator